MPQSKSFRLHTDRNTYVYRDQRWTLDATGQRLTDERIVDQLSKCRAMTDGSFLDLRNPPCSSPNFPKDKASRSKKKARP